MMDVILITASTMGPNRRAWFDASDVRKAAKDAVRYVVERRLDPYAYADLLIYEPRDAFPTKFKATIEAARDGSGAIEMTAIRPDDPELRRYADEIYAALPVGARSRGWDRTQKKVTYVTKEENE